MNAALAKMTGVPPTLVALEGRGGSKGR